MADRSQEEALTHCTGPCEQGTRRCPTPEACEFADLREDDAMEMLGRLLTAAATVVGLLVAWWVWP